MCHKSSPRKLTPFVKISFMWVSTLQDWCNLKFDNRVTGCAQSLNSTTREKMATEHYQESSRPSTQGHIKFDFQIITKVISYHQFSQAINKLQKYSKTYFTIIKLNSFIHRICLSLIYKSICDFYQHLIFQILTTIAFPGNGVKMQIVFQIGFQLRKPHKED